VGDVIQGISALDKDVVEYVYRVLKLVDLLVKGQHMVKEGRWESGRGRYVARLDMFSIAKGDNPFLIRSHVLNELPNTRSRLEELNIFHGQGSYDRDRFDS